MKLEKTIQKRKVFNFIMQISLSNFDEKREKKENLWWSKFSTTLTTKILFFPRRVFSTKFNFIYKMGSQWRVLLSISSTFYDQLLHTQSARKTDNLTVFFALLGSARVKAGCRTLMKLQFGFVTFWQKDIGEKSARKMLTKLTPGL